MDAILLARSLYRGFLAEGSPVGSCNSDAIPLSLANFERDMLARSSTKVKASAEAAEFLHSESAVKEGNRPRGGEFRNLLEEKKMHPIPDYL